MAQVELRLSSKVQKETGMSEILIRFFLGRKFSVRAKSHIFVSPEYFEYNIDRARTEKLGVRLPNNVITATQEKADKNNYVLRPNGSVVIKQRLETPDVKFHREQAADAKRFINIIIKHWKAEIKEFARDAMNEIKSILFGAESTVAGRKTYVSDAFVWAKVFADLEMDEQWEPDYSKLEPLQEDAMRIADGTWESHRQERQHRQRLKQLLSAAVDAVIAVSNTPNKKSFDSEEEASIDAYLAEGGTIEEIWNAAKDDLGTWDEYAKRVLYAYSRGESIGRGMGY